MDGPGDVETTLYLWVLEVGTESPERRELAGDVTVLAQSEDLVVAHLRDAGREGGGLGVLVDLALEAVGRGLAEVATAVGDGDGAGDLAGQDLSRVAIHDELVAAAVQLLNGVGDEIGRAHV